jgi:putative sterol carrier protein
MRWLPQYFRADEARGMAFTTRFELHGPGGGTWTMHVRDGRCEVHPGAIAAPDLVVRMAATHFLAVHRGEANAAWGLVTGRIRLAGRRRLFLAFPRLFPTEAPSSLASRWRFRLRRLWRRPGRSR